MFSSLRAATATSAATDADVDALAEAMAEAMAEANEYGAVHCSEAEIDREDASGPLIVTGGPHFTPLSMGARDVEIREADQHATVSSVYGNIQVLRGTQLRATTAADPAVFSDRGAITLEGATIHGDVLAMAGPVTVGPDTCVHGDVQHRGPAHPTSRNPAVCLEYAQVCGKVQAETISLMNSTAKEIVLEGTRREPLGGEARLDLGTYSDVGTVRASGAAVVVFHSGPLPQLKLIGEGLQCLHLGPPPSSLAELTSRIDLPRLSDPLTWETWRHLQHGLEFLCQSGLSRFQDRVNRSEWAGWTASLEHNGQRVAALFLRWLQQQPVMLLTGLQALGNDALERGGAGLALGLMGLPRPTGSDADTRDADVPAVMRDITTLMLARKVIWKYIRWYMHQLQGIDAEGRPLAPQGGPTVRGNHPPSRQPDLPLPEAFVRFRDQLMRDPASTRPGSATLIRL